MGERELIQYVLLTGGIFMGKCSFNASMTRGGGVNVSLTGRGNFMGERVLFQ